MKPSGALVKIATESAYRQALKSFEEGGVPVGAALTCGGAVVAQGHNRRVQKGSNILHGEMDCLENAGHAHDFTQCVMFTTLSPCRMCANAIILFRIPFVYILDNVNTDDFETNEDLLAASGVSVIVAPHEPSMALNRKFQTDPKTRPIWTGDVGE
ncbi:MAG: nucleoside deaminase [Parvularculaceae bacterium]